jgi:hypothetical protein
MYARSVMIMVAAREHLPLRLSVAHSAMDHPTLGHLLLLLMIMEHTCTRPKPPKQRAGDQADGVILLQTTCYY